MFEPMFSRDYFRAITDDREREVREIVRVRNFVRDAHPERPLQLPRREPKPRR
jgi:hypothetical protein